MADTEKVLVQRVKFTGKRTGLDSIAVKGYGRVPVGATIEVTADEAERYTAKLPTSDGEASDFTKVGGEFEVEKSEVMNRRMASRDKLDNDEETLEAALPDEVNTEPAHDADPGGGTVEEYAEVVQAEPEAEGEESKKGSPKK